MPSISVPQQPRSEPASRSGILAVVLVYTLFAAAWILLSDKLVEIIFSDPNQIILVSMLKGWLFVGVTSLLLYFLMRRWFGGDTLLKDIPSSSNRLALPFIFLAAAIILFTGVGVFHTFAHQKEEELSQLKAIADLKSKQIADWLGERRRDAEFIRTSIYFAEQFRRWRELNDLQSGEKLQIRLEQFRQNRGLSAIMLLDVNSSILWASAKAPVALASNLQAAVKLARQERKLHIPDPYRDAAGNASLDFIVPLTVMDGPFPLVILHIELADWLFPTLQAWPVPSKSGEIILFKNANNQVLFLNELRYLSDTAAGFRLPQTTEKLLSAQILRGEISLNSPFEGLDYRGMPVIGLTGKIAGTDWYLMAKQDRSELLAHALGDVGWICLVGFLSLMVAGAGYFLIRQEQQKSLAEAMRQSQTERLRALQLLGAIADCSDDAIFAKDLEGRYILFNYAAGRFVGKPVEEVLGHDDRSLFPIEQAEKLMNIGRKVITEKHLITQEEILHTTQGERIFLATKGPLYDADGKIIGLFGISRDITEQKQGELALIESESRFRALVEQSLAGIYVIQDNYFRYVNPVFATTFGYESPEQVIDRIPVSDLVSPEDRVRVAENIRKRLEAETKDTRDTFTGLRIDGSRIDLDVYGCAFTYQGRPAVIGLILDVTARLAAQEQLRISEERLQLALNAASDGLWDWNLRSGVIFRSSQYYKQTGYRPDEATPDFEFFKRSVHPEDLAHVLKTIEAHKQGKTPVSEFDYRLITPSGTFKWMNVRGQVVERDADGAPLRMVGTITDISTRKAAEESLLRQTGELAKRNEELQRFNRVMVGRELDMIALKQQVNALSIQLGQEPPFTLSFLDAASDLQVTGDQA